MNSEPTKLIWGTGQKALNIHVHFSRLLMPAHFVLGHKHWVDILAEMHKVLYSDNESTDKRVNRVCF
jgi:hypothetical protein